MAYSYDRVGNRTDSNAQVETGNRLTAFDGYTLAWDSTGLTPTCPSRSPNLGGVHGVGQAEPVLCRRRR